MIIVRLVDVRSRELFLKKGNWRHLAVSRSIDPRQKQSLFCVVRVNIWSACDGGAAESDAW
jgi:hypothetical protein